MRSIEFLIEAYKATSYNTIETPYLSIRIAQMHPILDKFMTKKHYSSWTFITAANPMSEKQLSAQANRKRNEALEQLLFANGIPFLHAEGVPDTGEWQAEPSFLAFDLSLDASIDLARTFEQKAFVYGNCGSRAELIIT